MLLIKYTKFTTYSSAHPLNLLFLNHHKHLSFSNLPTMCSIDFIHLKTDTLHICKYSNPPTIKHPFCFKTVKWLLQTLLHNTERPIPLRSLFIINRTGQKKNLATFCYEAHNHLSCGSLAMERQTLALTHTLREITQRVTSIYNQPSGNPTNFTQFQ